MDGGGLIESIDGGGLIFKDTIWSLQSTNIFLYAKVGTVGKHMP